MGSDRKCTRWTAISSNLVFTLVGAGLAGFGIFVLISSKEYLEKIGLDDSVPLKWVGVGVIVLGSFIFLISGLGIYGVLRKNVFILNIYLVIAGFLVFIQLGAGIALFVLRSKVPGWLDSTLASFWDNPDNFDNVIIFQNQFKCCGYKELNIPAHDPSCSFNVTCKDKANDWIRKSMLNIGISVFAVYFLQTMALISSLMVKRSIAKMSIEDEWMR